MIGGRLLAAFMALLAISLVPEARAAGTVSPPQRSDITLIVLALAGLVVGRQAARRNDEP